MRMRLLSCCCLPMLLTAPLGCTATPGFQWSISFTQPPVLRQPAPITPIQAPATAYAVEQPQPFVQYVRQPILSPRMGPMAEPVCPPGCAPAPAPVPAAMPQQQQQPCPPTMLPAPMPRGPAKMPAGDCE